jgi:hypothetical protein
MIEMLGEIRGVSNKNLQEYRVYFQTFFKPLGTQHLNIKKPFLQIPTTSLADFTFFR